MAQKEPDIGPSLELPSLFGRRKRRTQAEGSATTVSTVDEAVSEPIAEPTPSAVTASGTAREKSARSVPEMAASTAAFLVGAVVGLLGCLLTYGGLQGCELVTGTDSCGGPGLLVLVVILALMILAGAAALRALRVPEAGSVSFLGIGIMTAIVLLILSDHLYDPWMFAVVPVVTAVGFLLGQWVTSRVTDDVLDDDDDRPRVDIR